MKKVVSLVFGIFFIASCNVLKDRNSLTLKKLKNLDVVENHYKNDFDFNTLNIRAKTKIYTKNQSVSPNITMRMKKDEMIWISAKVLGITVAKMIITPDKVSYYEKVNNSYFEGGLEVLNDWLGTTLDFNGIQQLLLGQALFSVKQTEEQAEITKNLYYRIQQQVDDSEWQAAYEFNPINFKLVSQEFIGDDGASSLTVNYNDYQEIEGELFPKVIHIEGIKKQQKTILNLEFKSVDYNVNVRFPYEIPSDYKEVLIE